MEEYIIEVILTPHYHDNKSEPYFWALLIDDECGNKYNCGSGWAVSPEEAYKQALDYYKNKWID